ncbi:unnamed protein product [Mytilus coruscus]|uniref:MEGF10_11 n=1 Tax=Mytilus coruscus TaxID=42192 RepID=A0A6J7ZTS6_MYTCO|nr:unnamed protein product [Mytilus coruscus]
MATCNMTILKCALHICIYLSCYANICFHDDNEGFNEDSVYNKDYFCCDYYERIGMACVECAIGYTSTKGKPCKPCSGKSYGYRCADTCNSCTRCNHVHGCLHASTTDGEQLSNLEMFVKLTIFIVCIGCACIFVLVVSGIFFYKRRKDRTTDSLNMHVHSAIIPHQTENRIESIYEEIDDMALPEAAQHPNLNTINEELYSNSSSSLDKNSMSNHEDQYLNPYQIIVQDVEHRPYFVIGRSDTEIKNIESSIEGVRNEQCQEESDEQDGNTKRQLELELAQSYSLNYPKIQIFNNRETANFGRYKNTQMFSRQLITNPSLTEKTEYVEIIHIV